MDEEMLRQIYESVNRGEKVALATITESTGSTPRKTGSTMAVWEDGRILGSVGGGRIEYEIIQSAIQHIKEGKDGGFDHKLNSKGDIGMECGGHAKGFIKLFIPRPRLIIVGGGHIGEQLFKLAKILQFYTVIVDDREEYANKSRFEDADEVMAGNIGEILSKYPINENTYIAIATRGYMPDGEALKAVVSRGAAYIGMIGSSHKVILVMKKLIEEGISREELQKVYAPMGLNISSELPQEIALGIMSEIVLIKNKGSLNHRRDTKKVVF